MLELAILGLLQESAMHGYELRKQLTTKLGTFRATISYGSLYPTLRRMQTAGWLTEEPAAAITDPEVPPLTSRRGRVVYKITAEGKERFQALLAETGPETYEDTAFGVHFAFFARTDQDTRLRILEGRRRKVEERREGMRVALSRAASRLDAYTLELQRHGLDACEREVRWLEELIATERSGRLPGTSAAGTEQAGTQQAPPAAAGTQQTSPAEAGEQERPANPGRQQPGTGANPS